MSGSTQGLLRGHVIGDKGVRSSIQISWLVVAGLGHSLFSVNQAARNGVVSILDLDNRRLECNNFTLPLQELGYDFYSFLQNFTDGRDEQEPAMQVAANIHLWYLRLGHLHHNTLGFPKGLDNSGVSFDRPVLSKLRRVRRSVDEPPVGHPKQADHKMKLPFQL